jgi:hypothetical protein
MAKLPKAAPVAKAEKAPKQVSKPSDAAARQALIRGISEGPRPVQGPSTEDTYEEAINRRRPQSSPKKDSNS